MNRLRNDNRIYVAADKTNNYYSMPIEAHDELLMKNIHNEFRRCNDDYVDKVNENDKKLAEELEILNRVYGYSKCDTYITI